MPAERRCEIRHFPRLAALGDANSKGSASPPQIVESSEREPWSWWVPSHHVGEERAAPPWTPKESPLGRTRRFALYCTPRLPLGVFPAALPAIRLEPYDRMCDPEPA